eukprot:CAMPEP_0174732320 /NCGR_PEP_ID=MMETSP1094-20130205/59169_1 /TAXON_ID=156173 /ORGANISM="Chrysochromulina brevifilum, Strain UTEX LB 985" /LENGTH=44 /DNA_ID= /DNA_START= /DNA_END= /DNA_ORIENTATION=
MALKEWSTCGAAGLRAQAALTTTARVRSGAQAVISGSESEVRHG